MIRISPEKEDFDIFDEIGEIQGFISRSNKKLSKKSTKNEVINEVLSNEEMNDIMKIVQGLEDSNILLK